MQWHHACDASAVAPDSGLRVDIAGRAIALFRPAEATLFAVDDRCPHENASLSDGYVEGLSVECPLHQAVFCLRTGRRLAGPSCDDLRTYPVRLIDGSVSIGLSDEAAHA